MKPTKTWVLVADATRAKIYENNGPGRGLREMSDLSLEEGIARTRELGTDRPGRTHDRFGKGRHALAPKADWHMQAKQEFADGLGEYLSAECLKKSYDRLVLVAPPRTLGHLRNALSTQAANLVTAEINKDLTGLQQRDIEAQVGALVVI